jgi:RNA polymerase sigma factor for flagellar operon FliA
MHTVSSQQLITDHLPYTAAVTNDFLAQLDLRNVIRAEDAVAYGRLGLTEAAARFSPDAGTSFATFSFTRIRGAVMDGIRKTWTKDRVGSGDDYAHHPPVPDSTFDLRRREHRRELAFEFDPGDMLDGAALRTALLEGVRRLDEVERQVIVLYYFEDLVFDRIGKRLGFTKSYVGRIHRKALQTLGRRLKAVGVKHGLVEVAQ